MHLLTPEITYYTVKQQHSRMTAESTTGVKTNGILANPQPNPTLKAYKYMHLRTKYRYNLIKVHL